MPSSTAGMPLSGRSCAAHIGGKPVFIRDQPRDDGAMIEMLDELVTMLKARRKPIVEDSDFKP